MNAVLADMLRRLHLRRPPTRGQMLRHAIRTAEGGRPINDDDIAEAADMLRGEGHMHVYPGRRLVLRDGTPYEESGADENDWRL